ncbi:MAG: hypothetical protein ACI9LM_005401 [Alteromonadaceae bacterium]|jgi:hypothetical protein
MNSLRIPTRIKFFPNFITDYFIKKNVLSLPLSNAKTFHLCYFSCESYFPYLYCALHSLTKHLTEINYKVYVFNDSDMPISESQIALIKKMLPDVEFILWPKSMGWGTQQIENIWNAYDYASKNANDIDIIARVDSDVFFFNDRIFQIALRSDADLIGDGHFVEFKYVQGGCYFFKANAINQINQMIKDHTIEKLVENIDIVVEDIAADYFARKLNLKVWQTWFMAFPQEIQNCGGINKWIRFKFSCAHFVMKNKDKMIEAYTDFILPAKDKAIFLNNLKQK